MDFKYQHRWDTNQYPPFATVRILAHPLQAQNNTDQLEVAQMMLERRTSCRSPFDDQSYTAPRKPLFQMLQHVHRTDEVTLFPPILAYKD